MKIQWLQNSEKQDYCQVCGKKTKIRIVGYYYDTLTGEQIETRRKVCEDWWHELEIPDKKI